MSAHRLLLGLTLVALAAGAVGIGAATAAQSATTEAVRAADAAASAAESAVAQADRDAADAVIAAEAARIAALRPVPVDVTAPLELPAAPEYSLDDPASLWAVVNKARPLDGGSTYVPSDLVAVPVAHTFAPLLRQEASDAVVALFDAAQVEAGLALASNSAYRAYSVQQRVYGAIVAASGQAYADTTSARPGHSEHQTGLSLDIGAASGRCSLDTCFADTAEGQWLAENAWRFGFELRYPQGMEAVTGFNFEPWHYRYLGIDLATTLHESGVTTLEEHFGFAAAPDYL